jgi:hypothetical protein
MDAIGGMENRVMKRLFKIQPIDRSRYFPSTRWDWTNRMIVSPEYVFHDNRIAE